MIDAVATMSKLLADKGNSLKAFAKSYFETTQDNVGLKDVITKLSKYLAQEDLSNMAIAKAHEHGHTINMKQIQIKLVLLHTK